MAPTSITKVSVAPSFEGYFLKLTSDFDAADAGKSAAWVTDFHKALRSALGPDYLISHAPISPWFQGSAYPDGAYETVFKNIGDELDFFNLQYYNAEDNYMDCKVSYAAPQEN